MKWLTDRNGSAQVVEISFVLPIAVGVVLALIYLAYAMFMRVYIMSIVQTVANSAESLAGDNGLYCVITGDVVSEEDLGELEQSYMSQLRSSCILPGMTALGDIHIEQSFHKPTLVINTEVMYFGREMFSITLTRDIYTPDEFVYAYDFGKNLNDDFGELEEIYDEVIK